MLPDLRFAIGAVLASALFIVTAFGIAATLRLAQAAKIGPLEVPRLLAYADRTDWSQFNGPSALRRFEELMRPFEGEIMPAALYSPAGAPPPVASLPAPEASLPSAASVRPADAVPAVVQTANAVASAPQVATAVGVPPLVHMVAGVSPETRPAISAPQQAQAVSVPAAEDVVVSVVPEASPVRPAPQVVAIAEAPTVQIAPPIANLAAAGPSDTNASVLPELALTASIASDVSPEAVPASNQPADVAALPDALPAAVSPTSPALQVDRASEPAAQTSAPAPDQPAAPMVMEAPTIISMAIESRVSAPVEATPPVPAPALPAPVKSAPAELASIGPVAVLSGPTGEPVRDADVDRVANAPTDLPIIRVTTGLTPLPRTAPGRRQVGRAATPARRMAVRRVVLRPRVVRVARIPPPSAASQPLSGMPPFTATAAQPSLGLGKPMVDPWLTPKPVNNKPMAAAQPNIFGQPFVDPWLTPKPVNSKTVTTAQPNTFAKPFVDPWLTPKRINNKSVYTGPSNADTE